MKKLLILLIFNIGFFTGFGASITMKSNTTVHAGDRILVNVEFEDIQIKGFARFDLELPIGFKIIEKNSGKGDFSFTKRKMSINWMQFREKGKIKISFYIEVPLYSPDKIELEGKLNFIDKNSVNILNSNKVSIEILNSQTLVKGDSLPIDTAIFCLRRKPIHLENNQVIIQIEVKKNNLNQFGKIVEEIPNGYRAEGIQMMNSIFAFKENIVKFIWMKLPVNNIFVVAYKLIPEIGEKQDSLDFKGEFSFAESGCSKTIPVIQK